MTQSKNTLRKVRNLCAEAWLKEPVRAGPAHGLQKMQQRHEIGGSSKDGLNKGCKAFPKKYTGSDSSIGESRSGGTLSENVEKSSESGVEAQ